MDMLRIKEKDIIVDKSELLYRADFSNGGLEKDFEIAGGKWVAENDGVLGYMEEDGGGFIGMGQPTSSMRGGRFFQIPALLNQAHRVGVGLNLPVAVVQQGAAGIQGCFSP